MPRTRDAIEDWLTERNIMEVECMVPDLAGVPRGKILPTDKFVAGLDDRVHRLPRNILIHTLTGEYLPVGATSVDTSDGDLSLDPDFRTIRLVPWYEDPTAQIIADCRERNGKPIETYTRNVLKRVLRRYQRRGWEPIVAPELEFYLVEKNTDPDYPLRPPVGASGRREIGRQEFGIDAVNEFDPFFEDVYDYCEAQQLDIDTLNHESGAGQMEINFRHGNALDLADQVFLFKRTVRQTAQRHGFYATFMAKPIQNQPGSAMHVHQSVYDVKSRANIFSDKAGHESALFRAYLGGLQTYLPALMPLLAPNVNSYRRIRFGGEKMFNLAWGYDNRLCGLRIPESPPEDRRVENRVPGSDTNPYLSIAASLTAGFLGMTEKAAASKPVQGDATDAFETLPLNLTDALQRLETCAPVRGMLGSRFIKSLSEVMTTEYEAYLRVVSSWEREYLLLAV